MIGLSDGSRYVRHYVYVDNLGVMGCSKDEVARVLGEVTTIFERVGLAVHGLEMSGGDMRPRRRIGQSAPENFCDSRGVLGALWGAQSPLGGGRAHGEM